MRILAIVLSFTVLSRLFAAEPELKGSPQELTAYLAGLPRIVPVLGEGEVKVEADRAAITLKVTTEHKGLEETLQLNQEVRAKIIKMLNERGIPADRIKASRFSSTPRYGIFGDKAKSYKVENLLRVTITSEEEFRTVGSVTDRLPEVEYVNIEFQHTDKEALKRRVLNEALDNATSRKQVIEQKLGVTLQPRGVADQSVTMQVPERRGEVVERYVSAGKGSSRVTPLPGLGAAAEREEAGSVFGEITFTSRVVIEYAMPVK